MSEDLSQMLQNFLGTKEGQQQLQSVAEMLGSGEGGFDLSQLSGLLGGGESPKKEEQKPTAMDFGGLDMNMIMKLQQMMGQFNSHDKNTDLIMALKPHLKPERQSKADDAIKIMRLISLLPLLKDSGLFGKLGGV